MARIRTVKPEFWQHPKVTRVSRDARLLFLGLLNEADDEGKLRYSAKRLAGVLFSEDDDVEAADVDRWADELEREDLAHRYDVEGAPLLIVCGFTEHQSINRPSKSRLPSPPATLTDASLNCVGGEQEGSSPEGNREQGKEHTVSSAEPFKHDFELWWAEYPRKIAKSEARGAYVARRRQGVEGDRLFKAVLNYREGKAGTEAQFIKHGASFLAKDGPWSEWEHGEPEPPPLVFNHAPNPRRADEVRRCKLCANTGNYVKNGNVTPCKAHVYA